MNLSRSIFTILLFTITMSLQAQISLKGRIVDNNTDEPLLFAQVALFEAGTDNNITHTQSDEDGYFQLATEKGNYDVKIFLIGFEDKILDDIDLQANKDLGKITLVSENQQLNEVVVKSSSIPMRTDVEGIVITPENNLANIGGTLLDLLRNTPSVSVSEDGSISLRGSSATNVLINGRNSSLTKNLDQIPASAIDQVKIINNPNARYDAEAEGGVINIILKKGENMGTHGGAEITYGTRDRLNTGARINHTTAKFNVYAGYNYRNWKGVGNRSVFREIFEDNELLNQNTASSDKRVNHNLNYGADYYFGKNSLSYQGVYFTGDDYDNRTLYSQLTEKPTGDTILEYIRKNSESEADDGYDNAMIYERTFDDKNREFKISVNNSYQNQYKIQNIDIYRDASEVVPENLNGRQQALTDEKRYTTVAQADYVHPINEKVKLEMGLKSTFRKFDNDYKFYEFSESENDFVENPDVSNHFLYKDRIQAAYFIYSRSSEKFDYTLGTRAEHTHVEGLLYNTNELNKQDYLNLFPSIQTLYKLDDKNSFKFTYSRRIDRPTAWRLNPFPDITDSLSVRRGNPELAPEMIDSFEIGHMVNFENSSLTTNLFYRHTNGVLDYITVIEDGISYMQPENLNSGTAYGVEFIGIADITDWWNINGSISAFYTKVDGSNIGEEFVSDGFMLVSKITSSFKLPYGLNLQLVGDYESPEVEAQGKDYARYSMDATLLKNFFEEKGSLSLSVRDVFNTANFGGYNRSNQFYQEFRNNWETRILLISARYNF
ncbi:TonB-dependent receptor [Echinicola marina]|uniref:TonB-dependent receptor family protein n=1 Tax=Echinicola marina TaxID=2859768 RepID=UPI001CF6A6C0|nr:TonB-dependent receptor family protein [Echinicola marina]UCS93147.1 TonB-dependent receptor [Echinicola marina]